MICGIIFDKDGTLFDFQATWSGWAEALLTDLAEGDPVRRGVLGDALGYDIAARQFRRDSVVIAGTAREAAAALLPHLSDPPGLAALTALIDARAAEIALHEAVPLVDFLAGLTARGLPLAVVTNDSEAPARAHLDAVGIAGAFVAVLGADSGHGAKPMAGPVLAAAAAIGTPPEAVLMVGDSRHDLLAGRAAGMRTCGVLTGLATEAELAPLADIVLPHIGYLPDWLDTAAGAGM